jgi:hypothetical protein
MKYKCLYCNEEEDFCNCWDMVGMQTVYVCNKHFIDHAIHYIEHIKTSKYMAQSRDGQIWIENK